MLKHFWSLRFLLGKIRFICTRKQESLKVQASFAPAQSRIFKLSQYLGLCMSSLCLLRLQPSRVVKSQMSQLKFPPPVWVKTLTMMGDSVSDDLVRMGEGEGSDWAAGLGEVEEGELQGGELPC